jgi:hypothetical protein
MRISIFKKTTLSKILGIHLILLGLIIFSIYVRQVFRDDCWKLGYTLCAARGEDYFTLYQRAFNFFHGYLMYGVEAWKHAVSPYPIPINYLPVSALIWGWVTIFFTTPQFAYKGYLYYSIALHVLSIYLIYYIWKKLNRSFFILSLALFFWLSFFPLMSEWIMGQFNHLPGMFFLATIVLTTINKERLSGILWNLSLAWKPTAIFFLPYFIKNKRKTGLIIFILLFCVFTLAYGLYYELVHGRSNIDYFSQILNLVPRQGYEIHYIDNFGFYSFLGEAFYDKSVFLYNIITKAAICFCILYYCLISFFVKFKDNYTKLIFAAFSSSTILMIHKEIWESWLTFWLPVVIILLFIAKTKKEVVFISICALIIGTPSLFYLWELNKTELMRNLLITEKAFPQLLLYIYISLKMLKITELKLNLNKKPGKKS